MKTGSKYIYYSFVLIVVSLGIVACGSGAAEDAATESAPVVEEIAVEDSSADADAGDSDSTDVDSSANESAESAESDDVVVEEIEGITTDSGLQYIEVEAGDGDKPVAGDIVQVHYTGKLQDGTVFDSSVGRAPFGFQLGAGRVIAGWDEGIAMVNEGGKAMLIIPPELGYGDREAGSIPPGSTLIFDVELVSNLGAPPSVPTEIDEGDYTETESGLKYFDLKVGDGATPESGNVVSVYYAGWLTDGTKFDSAFDRAAPITFGLGQGQVIPGWDEGLSTMKVGDRRQLVIPPDLAYGDAGYGSVIPPDSTLIFEVELIGIQE